MSDLYNQPALKP
jgi:hypothetical protein